jgi:hypothetical protein
MVATILGIFFVLVFLVLIYRFVGQSASNRTIASKKEDASAWQPGYHNIDHSDGGSDGGGE